MTHPLIDHLRQLADTQHEGSELEVTLRHAADRLDALEVYLDDAFCECYDEYGMKFKVECDRCTLVKQRDQLV